jgi:hypothetical protein
MRGKGGEGSIAGADDDDLKNPFIMSPPFLRPHCGLYIAKYLDIN